MCFDYIKFYFKLKELVLLQQELNFGKNVQTPSVFSEKLVKYLCDYQEWEGKDFDAKTSDNKGVEIKATGKSRGTTKINYKKLLNKKFSHLCWIFFDFKKDQLVLRIFSREDLQPFIDSKLKEKDPRQNITLSKYISENVVTTTYKITRTKFIKLN